MVAVHVIITVLLFGIFILLLLSYLREPNNSRVISGSSSNVPSYPSIRSGDIVNNINTCCCSQSTSDISAKSAYKFIVIESEKFMIWLQTQSNIEKNPIGAYIDIVPIESGGVRKKLVFSFVSVSDYIGELEFSNFAFYRDELNSLSADGITITDFNDSGFLESQLEFYSERNETVEYVRSFISMYDLMILISNSKLLVISGARVVTGQPIDPSYYERDLSGNVITDFFTFKIEGYEGVSQGIIKSATIRLKKPGVNERSAFSKPRAKKAGDLKKDKNITGQKKKNAERDEFVEVPLMIASTPCPPRWFEPPVEAYRNGGSIEAFDASSIGDL